MKLSRHEWNDLGSFCALNMYFRYFSKDSRWNAKSAIDDEIYGVNDGFYTGAFVVSLHPFYEVRGRA